MSSSSSSSCLWVVNEDDAQVYGRVGEKGRVRGGTHGLVKVFFPVVERFTDSAVTESQEGGVPTDYMRLNSKSA